MKTDLRIFACAAFTGHYPVGTAAIVVAASARDAMLALNAELVLRGLPGDAIEAMMIPVETTRPSVCILNDGDY